MRVFASGMCVAFAVAVLAACSSSSSNSNSGGAPTCKGAAASGGPGSSACNACLDGMCGSQIAAVNGACGAYVACFAGCQCTDLQCITGCLSNIDSNCQDSYGPLTQCLSGSCSSQCTGTLSVDGG